MVAFAETKVAINERIRIPAVVGVLMVVVGVLLDQTFVTSLAIGASTFVVVGSIFVLVKTVQQSGKRTIIERPRKVGAMIVHIGIALIGLSIVLSSNTWSQDVTLTKAEPSAVGPYSLTFISERKSGNEDVISTSVDIKVVRDGELLGVYAPNVRTYPARNMSVGTPSVHTSFVRDTYLTMITTPAENKVNIKIAQNPAVLYIWLSGILIVVGAVISLLPQRRKIDEVKSKAKTKEPKVEVSK